MSHASIYLKMNTEYGPLKLLQMFRDIRLNICYSIFSDVNFEHECISDFTHYIIIDRLEDDWNPFFNDSILIKKPNWWYFLIKRDSASKWTQNGKFSLYLKPRRKICQKRYKLDTITLVDMLKVIVNSSTMSKKDTHLVIYKRPQQDQMWNNYN